MIAPLIEAEPTGGFRVTFCNAEGEQRTYMSRTADIAIAQAGAAPLIARHVRIAASLNEGRREIFPGANFYVGRARKRSTDPAAEAKRAAWREKAAKARARRAAKSTDGNVAAPFE